MARMRTLIEKFRRRKVTTFLLLGMLVLILFFVWPLPKGLREGGDATLRILDRNGTLLYEHRGEAPGSHDFLPLRETPKSVIAALLSVEDRSFFRHYGVSPPAILRALFQNITAGKRISGASTITQQLIRVTGGGRRTLLRKMTEAMLAVKVDLLWSKERILETYLNRAYFGHQAYGIQAAAHTYLGKDARELSTAESAFLVGLLQSPSGYDPFTYPERAEERQKTVLKAMEQTGQLQEGAEEAQSVPVRLHRDVVGIKAPHFVFWVLSREDLPASGDVVTTLDLPLQSETERIVERQLTKLAEQKVGSAAVVVLDAETGEVLAMVGSHDYFDAENEGAVNVALSARQPGSSVKPFTYALAFERGETAASTIGDVFTQFWTAEGMPYTPRNYDFDEHGLVRYREALANSYNISAVKILEKVGVNALLGLFRHAGITTLSESADHYGLALTLGDAEVTLLELTRAYGVFARGGVTLHEKNLLGDRVQRGERVMSEESSWLVSDILSDPVARLPQFGSSGPLTFPYTVAAKTGTTRNSRDNWTLGYTTKRVVGVWVGNIDNTPMRGTSGVTGAGPIFHEVMDAAMNGISKESFPKPKNIISKQVCALSGKLPGDCPNTIDEWFTESTVPTAKDDLYVPTAIDMRNGMRATPECPPQYVHTQIFVLLPQETREWGIAHGYRPPPAQVSPLCGGSAGAGEGERWLRITRPNDGEHYLLDPLIPDSNERITLTASAGTAVESIEWSINGKSIGTARAPDFRVTWEPMEGTWKVTAKAGELSEEVQIRITKR